MNALHAVALIFALCGDEAGTRSVSVDPDIQIVVAAGNSRLVVYRICSPEHCWSLSYLQWLEDGVWPERKVIATKEVPELGYGKWVDSAKGISGEPAKLEVQVSPSHGGFEPFTLTVIPGRPGVYTTSGAPKYAK